MWIGGGNCLSSSTADVDRGANCLSSSTADVDRGG